MFTRKNRFILMILMLAWAGSTSIHAGDQNQTIRVATYNIEWFGGQGSSPERIERLKTVIELLDADVIGLQEIADEDALRLIFSEDEWQIMIDEDSYDNQDVALAVRLPFTIMGHEGVANVDAEDEDFLFPDDRSNDFFFPGERDILFSEIQSPDSERTFFVMVQHAKARSGGRTFTDRRREGASQLIAEEIERRFDGESVILLGDFNDNPDDVSLNILETGDADAAAGPGDNSDDHFFVNLTEPLLAEDHVTWGLTEDDIDNGVINTVVEGSRDLNNETRGGDDDVIAPVLIDQILISANMLDEYTVTLTEIFDDPVAQEGHSSGQTIVPRVYASDHLPVLAELAFDPADPDED